MLIICPNCQTSYRITPTTLGAHGRSVRCARCQSQWFATAADVVMEAPVVIPRAAEPAKEAATQAAAAGGMEAAAPPAPEPAPPADDDVDAWSAATAGEPAPSIVPPGAAEGEAEEAPVTIDERAEDIETVAARKRRPKVVRKLRRKVDWRRAALPVTLIGLVAVFAGLIAGRAKVVRALPQTAPLFAAIGLPVNLRGLAFEDVKTTSETSDDVKVLVVEGTIANVSGGAAEVPRLRFAVRNAAGVEVYNWTAQPSRSILGPGEKLEFRSRLASPPADSHEVTVRFFHRRDVVASPR